MPSKLFNPTVDEMDEVGVPMVIGTSKDIYNGAEGMIQASGIPSGMCFIVQRIVGQGATSVIPYDLSPVLLTPSATLAPLDGILFADTAGTVQWSAVFRPFQRAHSTFFAITPRWQNAEPINKINWKLKHPLCVPSGWNIQGTQNGAFNSTFAVYGRLISQTEARDMGFTVSNSVTDTDRMCGVDSLMTFSTTQIIVPAKTGYSIQILDIVIRNQPVAAVLTSGTVTVEQGDGRPIFVLPNNNPGDLAEQVFSPGIYLKSGQSLNAKSSTALIGNVVVSWRYVPDAEVPADHFWACIEPGLPTPATTGVGIAEVGKTFSHEITCFYPARNTTKTSPTKGYQHIVRGYMVAIQKEPYNGASAELLDASDNFACRISQGTAGSPPGLSIATVTDSSASPISPVFTANNHDMHVSMVVDDVNMPCKQDNGSIWIDTLAYGPALLTTPITTAGIDEFWVTVWGKTIPNRFTDPTHRGTAT